MSSSKPSKHSERKKARQEERDSKKQEKSHSSSALTPLAMRPHPQHQRQVHTSNGQSQMPVQHAHTQLFPPQLPYSVGQLGSHTHTTTTTTTTTTTSGQHLGHQPQTMVQAPALPRVQQHTSSSGGTSTHLSQKRVFQPTQKPAQQPSVRQIATHSGGHSSSVTQQPASKAVQQTNPRQASHSTHSHTSRQVSSHTQPAPTPAPAPAASQIAYGYDYSWRTYVPGQIVELPPQHCSNQVSTVTSSTQSQQSNVIAEQQAAQLAAATLQAEQQQATLQASREQAAREQAVRQQQAREQQMHEQQMREQQTREQHAREQAAQVQAYQQQVEQQRVEQQRVYQQTVGGEARKAAAIQGQSYLTQFDQRVQQMMISASAKECEYGAKYYPMSEGYLCGIGNHFISHAAVDAMINHGTPLRVERVNSAMDEVFGFRHVIPPADGWHEPMHWDPERRDKAGMIIMRYKWDGSQWDLSPYEWEFAYQRATGTIIPPGVT